MAATNHQFRINGLGAKPRLMTVVNDQVNSDDTIDTLCLNAPAFGIIQGTAVGGGVVAAGANISINSYAFSTVTGSYLGTVSVTNSLGAALTTLNSCYAMFISS